MARRRPLRFEIGRGAMIHAALLDDVTPTIAGWIEDWSPAVRRTLRQVGQRVVRSALSNAQSMFRRTGRNRTGSWGARAPARFSVRKVGSGSGSLWMWANTLLAAHELGASVGPATMRPRQKRVLGWGGPPGGPHTAFARIVTRRGFTLRRRPFLTAAYQSHVGAVPAMLEAEFQRLLTEGQGLARGGH